MKLQREKIERFLTQGWRTSWEVVTACGTVTPSKRISELRATGRLMERPLASNPRIKQYRLRKEAA